MEELDHERMGGVGGACLGKRERQDQSGRRGRHLNTGKLPGFLTLYLLAGMRRWRRGTLRYQVEQARIDEWLARIRHSADAYELAVEIAECQRLVKGYGDTHARGMKNFSFIMQLVERETVSGDIVAHGVLAGRVRRLRAAALADEDGEALAAALQEAAPAA